MTLTSQEVRQLTGTYGSPLFIYDRQYLQERASTLEALSLPYGLIARYAVKANNHPEIIKLFHDAGLHFDASSSYEAAELLSQGIEGKK